MTKKLYNIIRKQRRDVSIFRRNLEFNAALAELRHWKRLARNSGGHVYFEMVEVPEELTPEGIERTRAVQELKELEARIERRASVCIAAAHTLDEEGFCPECLMFPNGPTPDPLSELSELLISTAAA